MPTGERATRPRTRVNEEEKETWRHRAGVQTDTRTGQSLGENLRTVDRVTSERKVNQNSTAGFEILLSALFIGDGDESSRLH